jgi:hypothetical protein
MTLLSTGWQIFQMSNNSTNITKETAKIMAEREKRLAQALRDNLKRRKNSKVVLPIKK